jgi:hypothetical protein
MKKLMVEFFYSLAYSYSAKKVEEKINKYPIILEILVMYVRRVLDNLGISNADNYIFRLNT